MNFKYAMLAIAMLFATPVLAETAQVQTAPVCANGGSIQSFKEAAAKSNEPVLILEGKNLQTFADAVDAIILPGEHHDSAITALAFLNPEGNTADVTQVAIFKDGCLAGVIPLPTEVVKKALGKGV